MKLCAPFRSVVDITINTARKTKRITFIGSVYCLLHVSVIHIDHHQVEKHRYRKKSAVVVCINIISPMVSRCFIFVNISLVIILMDISSSVMSGWILFKMLVLGINETAFAFPLTF
jgi:hypothetical protein